ncbi:DUF305 domain-containing protein [Pelovirga terrestris]|uniref:DUF305 domain-containing protein n=1 Tax=Pelovirga terrestris TaxID=2771352 RepID=A0A8J6QX40_9BACT|nr:DUF305 domain-containing protein [Pelovirga terrestris]MBD1400506.1 DUF305 domain-containing protein [Pelovirga terrestris]
MKLVKRWLIVGLLLATVVFVSACTRTHDEGHQTQEAGHGMDHGMDMGPADETYDLRFIDGMIVHHQGAVEMAEEALLKSIRPEIRQLAEAIIAAQAEEIDLMNRWKNDWYPQAGPEPMAYDSTSGTSVPMSPAQIAAMKMSGDLGAKDAEFDLRFILAMIPHHQGAVDMAADALDKSQRDEIRDLAHEIIATQQAEIDLMMSWKMDWYGHSGH